MTDQRRHTCKVALTRIEAEALSRLLTCQVIMSIDGKDEAIDFRFVNPPKSPYRLLPSTNYAELLKSFSLEYPIG